MFSILRKIDLWVGKKMFIPLIIQLCQRMNITQYKFSDECFLIGYVSLLLSIEFTSIISYIFAILFCFQILGWWLRITSLDSEPYEPSNLLDNIAMRLFTFVMIIVFLLESAFLQRIHEIFLSAGTSFFSFGLYALTIKTIPPKDERETEYAPPAHAR